MKFFKPEDFYEDGGAQYLTFNQVAEIANDKLEREGRIVYCDTHSFGVLNIEDATHKALLINPEPIEKCTHPKEKIDSWYSPIKGNLENYDDLLKTRVYQCLKCGAKVQPKGFEEIV